MKKYQKYYDFADQSDLLYIAGFLDPRYKCETMKANLDEADAAMIIQRMIEMISQMSSHLEAKPEIKESANKKPTLQERMRRDIGEKRQKKDDIECYFIEPFVRGVDDEDFVLKWWQQNAGTYHRMAYVARQFLAIPASSVGVERLFSSGRDTLQLRRLSMKALTMRKLMMLKNKYKTHP